MRHIVKELKGDKKGVYAVHLRNNKYYPSTESKNKLEVQQTAFCMEIRDLNKRQIETFKKLEKISKTDSQGRVMLEGYKDFIDMGDLLC